MQFPGQGKPPVGVVFNCHLAAIDDVLALALLYGFDGKNESRVIAVSVSRASLNAAAFCEAVGRFYAGTVSGAFGGFGRTLPVGLSLDAQAPADMPMVTAPLAKKNAEGAPLYAHGIHKLNDTAEPVPLMRNALTAQYDRNAMVLLAGPATDLVKVLDLPGARELIARKVRLLAVAGEQSILADIAAARKLLAEWPTSIVFAGGDVGESLLFPAASIEKDFAWSQAHPVVDAYRSYKPMPYDAPTCTMSAVLYAVRPREGYFRLSEPGGIRVLDDGRTKFTPVADGKHRCLIVDPAQKERIVKTYTEIASARPVPRQFRFRPPQKKDVEPPKPPAPKPRQ